MKAILFDLDGVFYQGDNEIKDAHTVSTWVKENKIPHLFVTNTTSRPRSALINKLAGFGIETDKKHILTPSLAAVHWLKQHGITENIALFVPDATRSEFSELTVSSSPQEVNAVVLGDLGKQWDFDTLNQAFRFLMVKPQPEFIALGMTRYWQAEDGLRLDVAPFIVALEYASGVKATILGKPAEAFYQAALNLLNVEADQTLMIGDDIRGDIQGAQQAGLKALLVKTGKFRDSDLDGDINPDAVLDSVLDLPDWWQQHK